jgi:cell division protein ZapE
LQDVGAVDYLHISRHFHTICVRGIPVLTLAQREAARRFIVFVDNLYDQQVLLCFVRSMSCLC